MWRSNSSTELTIKFVLIGVSLLIAFWATARRAKLKARRRAVKREVRKVWQKSHPGELYPECPVCRLPFPQSIPDCPFCQRSRTRARAQRRDDDWAIETASGYGLIGSLGGGDSVD